MKKIWQIQTLYFYLVSFIALILMIAGSIKLTHTAIAYLAPLPENQLTTNGYPVPLDRKNDSQYIHEPDSMKLWEEKFGATLIEQEKERYDAIARENNKRSLIRELVTALAYIAAAIPIYLFHWHKIPQLEEV